MIPEMQSRRKFIKGTGALTGAFAVPSLLSTQPTATDLDFSKAKTDDELFALVRNQLLIPKKRIYLNTGSLGPSPLSVIDSVHAAMRQLESNPVVENWGELGKQMEEVRIKIAGFINADQKEILLTRNTTEGLSLMTQSLRLESGDEIITTTREHGGATIGMDFVNEHKGVLIKRIELPMPAQNVADIINRIRKAITSQTKLIILSHVNTVTGLVMPFAEISKLTRDKGIALVADGAQAPGLISVDVKAMDVDAYATSGHKWLLGPKETGFLYLRNEFQKNIKTTFTSAGFAAYSAASGTRNVALIIGLGTAIDFHTLIGQEKIRKRTLEIRNYCLNKLTPLKGLRVISPTSDTLSSGIVSFEVQNSKHREIFEAMRKQDIIIKLLPANHALRISCHLFVSKKDIDLFIKALEGML